MKISTLFVICLILVSCSEHSSEQTLADTVDLSDFSEPTELQDVQESKDAKDLENTEDQSAEDSSDTNNDVQTCSEQTPVWSPGTPIFREVTETWFAQVDGPRGVRINAVDLNGDGWTDLIIRDLGAEDHFEEGGQRYRWVLLNAQDHFEEITQRSGLLQTRFGDNPNVGRTGEVVASADVDNDGDWDVFWGHRVDTPSDSVETSELLINQGDGTFVLGPEDNEIRMAGLPQDPSGAAFVDVNRDGNIDLWITHNMVANATQPMQDRLYLGDGTGHFVEITESANLKTKDWYYVDDLNQALCHASSWAAAACDLNDDGMPELLASAYGRQPNHLWLGDPSSAEVHFQNHSIASGYAFDQRQDWTDNESARCYCKWHRDAPDCKDVPEPQYIVCNSDQDAFRWNHDYDREPFRLGGNSATTVCADINNDGKADLLTTEIVHWDVGSSSDPSEILWNTGETPLRFQRPGNEQTGLTREHLMLAWNDGDMTATVFDFDNDGWPDIYIGSSDYPGDRGLLYHQNPQDPGHFEEVLLEDFFEHHRSHGVVAVDIDRDGDMDLIVGHSRARCDSTQPYDCYPTKQIRIFENLVGQDRHWIAVDLKGGSGVNGAAIGTKVVVSTDSTTQTQWVDGGHGHYGTQNDPILHFGLGNACEAHVEITWPDASRSTTVLDLKADAFYTITPEGVIEH